MIDFNNSPSSPLAGEQSKLKNLMERTPGIGVLKSKFLTVLGNSNELLNGISNKLTLNISSSDSEYCDDEEEQNLKFDETVDYTKIDYESRRVKARRAHEEIISGRYRQPNLAPRACFKSLHSNNVNVNASPNANAVETINPHSSGSSSSSSSSTDSSCSLSTHVRDRSQVSSTTCSNSIESRHSGGYGRPGRVIAGARRSELDMQKDLTSSAGAVGTVGVTIAGTTDLHLIPLPNANNTTADPMWIPRNRTSNSSTLTSLYDEAALQVSPSVESTDWRNFIRSESQNSVPSWASSISLDCRTDEEPIKEFMKRFTDVLITKPEAIDLELKSQFGDMSRLDTGRQWFTRLLLEQKTNSKRVSEVTFHSLVQYFSILIFECGEHEDFAPAAVIMNLCFSFYYEIEVPGCDAYREYIYTYMRQQPIWHVLRFWHAAFFEAVQSEREQRLAHKLKRSEARRRKQELSQTPLDLMRTETREALQKYHNMAPEKAVLVETDHSSSSSSHRAANGARKHSTQHPNASDTEKAPVCEKEQVREHAVLRQLGVYTCNMHALGVPQNLCLEFLKKQSTSFNLTKDKVKPIKDNVHRMYHETDTWGAKEF